MIQKNIIVQKTARYFMSGEVTEATEQVWFVCHGYGQLASYFIRNFEIIQNERTVIIAPEGLHRFYWGGFSGKVVASWMTREDRGSDITDYVNYLNDVYNEVMKNNNNKIRVNILDFSQGTATVCRWLAAGNVKADNLILWAGAFPSDMDLRLQKNVFNELKTYLVIGDNDEFIKEEQVKEHQQELEKSGINFELIRFAGKHGIAQDALVELNLRL